MAMTSGTSQPMVSEHHIYYGPPNSATGTQFPGSTYPPQTATGTQYPPQQRPPPQTSYPPPQTSYPPPQTYPPPQQQRPPQQGSQYGTSNPYGTTSPYGTQYPQAPPKQYPPQTQAPYAAPQPAQLPYGQDYYAQQPAPNSSYQGYGPQFPYETPGKRDTTFCGVGGSSNQKATPEELRDMSYADIMAQMDTTMASYRNRQISPQQAMAECDTYMSQIRGIGIVDGDRATSYLAQRGITDSRRLAMEQTYQELLRANRRPVGPGPPNSAMPPPYPPGAPGYPPQAGQPGQQPPPKKKWGCC